MIYTYQGNTSELGTCPKMVRHVPSPATGISPPHRLGVASWMVYNGNIWKKYGHIGISIQGGTPKIMAL